MWEIALHAFHSSSAGMREGWTAAVEAVIAEHERREAEQVKPDPFAAEKAAFAQGKAIEFRDPHPPEHKWADCDGRPSWIEGFLYRVKPEPAETE